MEKNRKNDNNKRRSSKKPSLDNSSSDQKENRPKRSIKPNPNDSIPMSKQLQMKKTVQNKARAKRHTNNNNRVCGNGKVMPTLADLEKMFEDSDSDSEENTPIIQINNVEPPTSPHRQMAGVIDVDILISPTTRARIAEQVTDILKLQEHTDQPPRKRLKSYRCDSDDIQSLTTVGNRQPTSDTYCGDVVQNNTINHLESFQDISNECISNLETDKHDAKLPTEVISTSEQTSDSNKTVKCESKPCVLQSESVTQIFDPLPSTSKDNEIFIKNDALFSISLRQSPLFNKEESEDKDSLIVAIPTETISISVEIENKDAIDEKDIKNDASLHNILLEPTVTNDEVPKEDPDVQIVEIPIETIIIDDEIKYEPPDNTMTSVETVEVHNENIESNRTSIGVNDNDDDCVFVEAQLNTVKGNRNTALEDTNIEYQYIEPDRNIDIVLLEAEIIDVDAVIAQNQSLLDQYNKTQSNRLDSSNIVDVDVSTLGENSNNNLNRPVNENLSEDEILPANLRNNPNAQSPSRYEVINLSDAEVSNSINVQNEQRQTIDWIQRNNIQNEPTIEPSTSNNVLPKAPRVKRKPPTERVRRHTSHYHTQEPVSNADLIQDRVTNFFKAHRQPDGSQRKFYPPLSLLDSVESSLNSLAKLLTNRLMDGVSYSQPSSSRRNRSSTSSSRRTQHDTSQRRSHNDAPSSIFGHTNRTPIPKPNRKRNKSAPPDKTNSNTVPLVQQQPNEEKQGANLGDCPICMETLSGKVIASTICGHVFCMQCLQQAITANKRCPTCRKLLKKNGYHQIFL